MMGTISLTFRPVDILFEHFSRLTIRLTNWLSSDWVRNKEFSLLRDE